MDQKVKGERFYALHHRDHPFVMPNPWDAGTAKIMAARGFEALATTSAGVDHMNGKLEGTAGRNDMIANTKWLAESVDIPVAADLEDCYGKDAEGIAETINLAADAGAVGGSIEDAIYVRKGEIYPIEEAITRVKAAVDAAASLPFKFTLCARCEHLLYGKTDMGEIIERLQAYAEAGADVLYAPGLRTAEQVQQIVESVDKPVNVLLGMGNTTLSMADMHQLGVARVSLGSGIHRTAMVATIQALDEIQDNGTFGFTKGLRGAGAIDALLSPETQK